MSGVCVMQLQFDAGSVCTVRIAVTCLVAFSVRDLLISDFLNVSRYH